MMDQLKAFKGKAGSMSAPSFSMRYNAEGEEIEQVYDLPEKPEETKVEERKIEEDSGSNEGEKKGRDSPFLSKLNRRTGSLEEGETWRFLTDIKGRISKTVGEKIEEISKKKKGGGGLGSSVSDSESSSVREEEGAEWSGDKSGGESDGTPRASSESTTPEPSSRRQTSTPNPAPRRRKRKTGERIEVGVEATECELGGSISESKESLHLDSSGSPGLYAALQTWAPLVLPAILAVIHHTVDISPFLKGLLFGVMVAVEVMYLRERVTYVFGLVDPNLENLPTSFNLPFEPTSSFAQLTFSSLDIQKRLLHHEGWMNEFCEEYNPGIYHIALTSSVYVQLEGNKLKLSNTKHKVAKKAFWSESPPSIDAKHLYCERTYDVTDAKVLLLPKGLTTKRLWSKKYPICIKLKQGSFVGIREKTPPLNGNIEKASPQDNEEDIFSDCIDSGITSLTSGTSNDDHLEVFFKSKDEEILLENIGEHFVEGRDIEKKTDYKEQLGVNSEDNSHKDDEEEDIDSDFVQIDSSSVNRTELYLFARSDREKEIWYRRLAAAVDKPVEEEKCTSEDDEEEEEEKEEDTYVKFMKQIINITTPAQSKSRHRARSNDIWVNAIFGRIMYDILADPSWIGKIQEKIQRKLSAIKIPVFMEELVVSSLELGETVPVIEKSSRPVLNDEGLWIDLDLYYQGAFTMIVDTKINIMKLKSPPSAPIPLSVQEQIKVEKPAIFDSGAEDSAESSSEENFPGTLSGTPPKKKMLRVVDKIAASKYFHQVTENKYVKRALEGVSNTNISLIVEVKGLMGTLVLNIPPPPSNRLWYGFKAKPKLLLTAQPKWGERTINMLNMTSWIEKKLYQEFQKVLVLPNMDDLVIPVMSKDLPS